MERRPAGEIDHAASSLAELELEGRTLDSLAEHVGRLGVQALNGWDAAALSLVSGTKAATYGTTDERINPVDQAQYDADKGPLRRRDQVRRTAVLRRDDERAALAPARRDRRGQWRLLRPLFPTEDQG